MIKKQLLKSYDVFLSFADEDADVALSISAKLEKFSLKCKISNRSFSSEKANEESSLASLSDIVSSSSFLLIQTDNSENSVIIQDEVREAAKLGLPIIIFDLSSFKKPVGWINTVASNYLYKSLLTNNNANAKANVNANARTKASVNDKNANKDENINAIVIEKKNSETKNNNEEKSKKSENDAKVEHNNESDNSALAYHLSDAKDDSKQDSKDIQDSTIALANYDFTDLVKIIKERIVQQQFAKEIQNKSFLDKIYDCFIRIIVCILLSIHGFLNRHRSLRHFLLVFLAFFGLIFIIVGGYIYATTYIFKPVIDIVEVKHGDVITYGRYRGRRLLWSVYKIEEYPDSVIIKMIATQPIAYKSFDIPYSGYYNKLTANGKELPIVGNNVTIPEYLEFHKGNDNGESYIFSRGMARWDVSALHTWLNSDDEQVAYSHARPTKDALFPASLDAYNSSDVDRLDEKGFLTSFTTEEKFFMVEMEGRFKRMLQNGVVPECIFWPLDTTKKKISELPKYQKIEFFLKKSHMACTSATYSDLVTIPSTFDIRKILEIDKNLFMFNYNLEHTSLDKITDYTVSIWGKNSCGFGPSQACVYSGKVDNIKDMVIYTSPVSALHGVLPIISVKFPLNVKLLGYGRKTAPYIVMTSM